MGADRIVALFALDADDRPLTPHLQECRVASFGGEPAHAVVSDAVESVAQGGDSAENIGLRPKEISVGGQVLFGEARPDQREKNSPTGRLGETGRRDELGQACAAVARRPRIRRRPAALSMLCAPEGSTPSTDRSLTTGSIIWSYSFGSA